MQIVAKILVGLVALEHVYFLVLEMFLWDKPRTRKAFGMTEEAAAHTKVLAGNQGLYNGFLAAGLIWSLVAPAAYAAQLALFFLGCVIVAGLYGGYSVGRRILLVQLLPAGIALAAVLFAGLLVRAARPVHLDVVLRAAHRARHAPALAALEALVRPDAHDAA